MADEADAGSADTGAAASNGAAQTYEQQAEAVRAAYLAGSNFDDRTEDKPADKATAAEDDSDLDEKTVEDDAEETEPDEDESDDKDEDADLDEDKEKPDDKDEKDVDAETAKRLTQVRRTDKRLREQREKDWTQREADFAARVKDVESRWAPRIEAAERFEKLAARAAIDPVAALQALGVKEDSYEHTAQVLYTLAKAKDDPKARAAVAQLLKERELADEVGSLKKWKEERERSEKERETAAATEREIDAYLDSVAKATTDRTPLAKQYLKANPKQAMTDIAAIAYRLGQESGSTPQPKAVMIAFEKDRRRVLREHGIDPRAATPAQVASVDPKTKTAPKKDDKKPVQKASAKADDSKLSPKDEFLRLNGKYD